MFCTRCGKPIEPGNAFCQYCGKPFASVTAGAAPPAPKPEPPRVIPEPSAPLTRARSSRKKTNAPALIMSIISVLLAAVIVLMACGVPEAVFSSNKSFAEPEDAINYFFDRVKAGDFDGALAACAVDQISQKYDYGAMVKRIDAMSPALPYLPSEYKLYSAYDKDSVKNQIMRQLTFMALSAVLPDKYSDYLDGELISSIDFDSVVRDMDPKDFVSLEVADMGQNANAKSSNFKSSMDKQADIYGADEMTEMDVLYNIGGKYYAGGVTLLKYGSGWTICQLIDPLLNQPSTGALIPLGSRSDFSQLLSTGEAPQASETPEVSAAPAVSVTEAPAATVPTKSLSLGLLLPGQDSGWSKFQADDVSSAAIKYGFTLTVNYSNYDASMQDAQFEALLAAGTSCIAIEPDDVSSISAELQKAKDAGVYVILIGYGDPPAGLSGLYSTYVEYDYKSFADSLTHWMSDNLGSGLKIGEVTGYPGTMTTTISNELDSAAKAGGWTIVKSVQGDYTKDNTASLVKDMLKANPKINVIFCHTDEMALGAEQAVEDAGLSGKVAVVAGIGSEQDALNSITSGKLKAIAYIDPHIGQTILDIANGLLKDQMIEASYTIPPIIADKTSASALQGD